MIRAIQAALLLISLTCAWAPAPARAQYDQAPYCIVTAPVTAQLPISDCITWTAEFGSSAIVGWGLTKSSQLTLVWKYTNPPSQTWEWPMLDTTLDWGVWDVTYSPPINEFFEWGRHVSYFYRASVKMTDWFGNQVGNTMSHEGPVLYR